MKNVKLTFLVIAVFVIAIIIAVLYFSKGEALSKSVGTPIVAESANIPPSFTMNAEAPKKTPSLAEIPVVKHIVIIDPGHQQKADTTMEPDGPGSSTTKYRDSGGTYGQTTKKYEYQLNLEISLLLRTELQLRGYEVFLTRETNDVNLGNIDRAAFASDHNGEALIRIHANGSTDTSATGAMSICQTPNNPYQNLYTESRLLSDCLLDCYVASTGLKKEYVWETDTMAGNNWSTVSTTILEMGYMTNPSDDTNMSDPEFQKLMASGIADGVDLYFESLKNNLKN